jgi:multicomponent Na+:H+ antiporter subunit E
MKISLGVTLFITWLLWSGHYNPLILGFGVASCVLVVYLSARLGLVDREGHPIHLLLRLLTYGPWLIWAIVKANIDVAGRILKPGLPISPQLIKVKASQKTDLGRVFYANSITLTPGTVSVEVDGDGILVHAISREAAADIETGDMDRRVVQFEGES